MAIQLGFAVFIKIRKPCKENMNDLQVYITSLEYLTTCRGIQWKPSALSHSIPLLHTSMSSPVLTSFVSLRAKETTNIVVIKNRDA
jgi:hypothetical protein